MHENENEISKEEVDTPISGIKFNVVSENISKFEKIENLKSEVNKMSKDLFTTIKGHRLLGWCITLVIVIYGVEILRGGNISEVGSQVIEILKVLIFSVSGYLFGQRNS